MDRSGVTQVLLRDRFAGAHTVDMAVDKAWTAASFRTNTAVLAEATEPGKPMSGLRARPRVVAVGDGIVIEGGARCSGRSAFRVRRVESATTYARARGSKPFVRTLTISNR